MDDAAVQLESIGREVIGLVNFCLLLILVLAFMAGCRNEPVLRVGQVAVLPSLDPHGGTAVSTFRVLINVYEGLVRFRPGTLEVEPALAVCWQPNPPRGASCKGLGGSEQSYVFRLREGVRFHDGTPLTAEVVKASFNRQIDENHRLAPESTGPSAMLRVIDTVVAEDTHVVRFVLKRPHAPFLTQLAYISGLVVSLDAPYRELVESGRRPSGTGPFEIVDWNPGPDSPIVKLRRNEEYWDVENRSSLAGIEFRPYEDPRERTKSLLRGDVDVVPEIPPEHLRYLSGNPQYDVQTRVGPHIWYFILNTRLPPFDNREVRQAVNYAIDRERIARDLLRGLAVPATHPVPPAFEWAIDRTHPGYGYDPDKARKLISEAGAAGARVRLIAPKQGSGMLSPETMTRAVAEDLRAVGLDSSVTIEASWTGYLETVNPGLLKEHNQGLEHDLHMAAMAWMVDDPHTLFDLTLTADRHPTGVVPVEGFNSGYFENRAVDRLIQQGAATLDRPDRARIYSKLQALLHEEAPWLLVASWRQGAVASRRLEGFRLEPSFFLQLRDAKRSELPTDERYWLFTTDSQSEQLELGRRGADR